MIIKLIILAVVLYGVYFIFFKKPDMLKAKEKFDDSETVVECSECGVYISAKEAIIKDGKQYCSNECTRLK